VSYYGRDTAENLEAEPSSMRLDLFLKQSRLIPRRTLAHQVCSRGSVKVNGQPAKGSKAVRSGDVIEWRHYPKITQVRVVKIPGRVVVKKEATGLYEVLKAERLLEEPMS
jgi:ribosomal 50S subunit-recycling heat shock protein